MEIYGSNMCKYCKEQFVTSVDLECHVIGIIIGDYNSDKFCLLVYYTIMLEKLLDQ